MTTTTVAPTTAGPNADGSEGITVPKAKVRRSFARRRANDPPVRSRAAPSIDRSIESNFFERDAMTRRRANDRHLPHLRRPP
eukprot:30326-Pelagococcus_subviridis.AAC.2